MLPFHFFTAVQRLFFCWSYSYQTHGSLTQKPKTVHNKKFQKTTQNRARNRPKKFETRGTAESGTTEIAIAGPKFLGKIQFY